MIEIRNCSKAFGEIHAIDHVLMEIGERQIFGLVGTNGAGKSTLLRMAAGVIKPDEGEILVDQEPVYENEKIKQQIFYISDGGFSTGIYGSRSERFLQRILSGLYDRPLQ